MLSHFPPLPCLNKENISIAKKSKVSGKGHQAGKVLGNTKTLMMEIKATNFSQGEPSMGERLSMGERVFQWVTEPPFTH